MSDDRDDVTRGAVPGDTARVYDIKDWGARPAMRRLRAPRALWTRGADPRPAVVTPPRAITPARHVPVRTRPAEAPAVPVLLVGCAESAALDRLAGGLGATGIVRNLGGAMPRSPRGSRVPTDVDVLETALATQPAVHIVCVGHLGCHATRTSGRYAAAGVEGPSRDTAVRAIEHHVFLQVHHVRTYLRRRGHHPEVRVSGLWVDEATGHVHAFDPTRRAFAPLVQFDLRPYASTLPAREAAAGSRP